MENKYDLIVLGSGPGGYVAALRAAALGQNVCLIEKQDIGGVCLNWGCIPTKTLLKTAHFFNSLKKSGSLGIKINPDAISLDFSAIQQRKKLIVDKLKKGIEFLLKKQSVTVISGHGKFIDRNTIDVDGKKIYFAKAIIATGSYPAELNNIKFNDELGIVSNQGVLSFSEVPKSLLIIGGGVIGCEFADIYSALGSDVTIVEFAEQILPNEDQDCVRTLLSDFKKRKIKIITSAKVELVVQHNSGRNLLVKVSNGEEIVAEKVLLSVGRIPNIENCGIDRLGIEIKDRKITVNSQMQTSISTIYAIGDAVGQNFLAHVASHQGIVAAEHIAGVDSKMQYNIIPRCIYTQPEIASVGLTEQQAEKMGIKVKIAKFPFIASGRAVIEDETKGMVKLIVQENDHKIIGAALCGPMATELVHEICLAMSAGLNTSQLGKVIHAHPTLSEAIMEAALDADGNSVHQ
jgi:dihydrolipoamide dehydrogenase